MAPFCRCRGGGARLTIERYLAELAGRLPRARRARFLADAEGRLRSPRPAIALVAHRFAVEAACVEARVASMLGLLAAAVLVFPLYVVPGNTLPPRGAAAYAGMALVAAPIALCSLVAAALAAGWAHSRRLLLVQD